MTARRARLGGGLGLAVAAALGAAGCRTAPADDRVPDRVPDGSSARPPAAVSTAGLLERLALLAMQHVPPADELARAARTVDADPASLSGYVDGLLRDPGFADDVAPSLFVVAGSLRTTQYVLKSVRAAGEVIYYLRKPCAPGDAEAVQPWWASTTTVRVCPDAHRPTYLAPPGTDWQCGSTQGSVEAASNCGCGPHLARCFRDAAQRDSIRGSLRRENLRTIAWIVDHDLPIEELFTSNATFRDVGAELIYTNWRMLDGETVAYPDPADWPRGGKWAPRPERAPGMHAGILTTPYTLLSGDATRALMRQLYELLWCKAPESSRVDAARIWALGVTDLRSGSGWQQLAAMPVCTRCHARLDHGAQFFSGFQGTLRSDHYMAALQQSGEEPLFGDDIDDPRGSAERTPQGFARAVTAQDEFAGCMVERVARHVFGGRPSPDDADALRGELARSHNLRAVVRVALLRAAEAWRRAGAAPVALPWPSQPLAADARGDLVLPRALHAELVRTCGDCHADGPRAFTGRAALDRPLLERMLRAVAFEDMPHHPVVLAPERRRAMVHDLIAMLYADPAAREAAREAYEAPIHWRAPLSEAARLAAVHAHSGVAPDDRAALDAAYHGAARAQPPRIADPSPLSPAMAVDLATAALADCARLGDAGRAACLDRALGVDELVTPDAD